MSKESSNGFTFTIGYLWLPLFIAVKLVGTSLAHWSWWWLLMPIVPVLSLVVKHFGL